MVDEDLGCFVDFNEAFLEGVGTTFGGAIVVLEVGPLTVFVWGKDIFCFLVLSVVGAGSEASSSAFVSAWDRLRMARVLPPILPDPVRDGVATDAILDSVSAEEGIAVETSVAVSSSASVEDCRTVNRSPCQSQDISKMSVSYLFMRGQMLLFHVLMHSPI